jgi:hypothetical protein
MKRQSEAPQVSRKDLLAAVLQKRASLIERDSVLLAEQLRLEKQGVNPAPPDPAPDPQQMARTLLNGFAGPELPTGSASARLFSIILDRQATQIALDALVSRELEARAIAVAEVMQTGLGDWRTITRRRALALIELRRANRDAAEFRQAVTALAGVAPGLVCDRHYGPLFGPPIAGDQGHSFLEAAAAEGIITPRERDAENA